MGKQLEQDKLTIIIEWTGNKVETVFDPVEDADFYNFFLALTDEERGTYIRAALTLAMLRDRVKERLTQEALAAIAGLGED